MDGNPYWVATHKLIMLCRANLHTLLSKSSCSAERTAMLGHSVTTNKQKNKGGLQKEEEHSGRLLRDTKKKSQQGSGNMEDARQC
ncbi:unnamed protein product [Prunus armeniaca]